MKNILILKTSHLGDTLRTTVILEGLKKEYPKCNITWITSVASYPLLQHNPLIDKLIVEVDIEDMNNKYYDIVISLQEEKDLLNRLYDNINFHQIYGTYFTEDKVVYTESSKEWYDMSLISKYSREKADELKRLNKKCQGEIYYNMLDLKWNNNKFKTYFSEEFDESDLTFTLDYNLPTVGIVLNAGKSWIMKSLYPDQIKKIVNIVNYRMGNKVNIILLSENYKEDYITFKDLTYNNSNVGFNKDCNLNEYINILNKCDVILTPDSLATHIGIGLNKTIFCYFTVTSFNEINLYDNGCHIVSLDKKRRLSYFKGEDNRPNCVDDLHIDTMIGFILRAIKK